MLGKLNLNETYLYAVLLWKSDWSCGYKVDKYSREYFAQLLFRKVTKNNVDTITKYTNHLEELGLLKKRQTYKEDGQPSFTEYTVIPSGNFISVYADFLINILKVSAKAKGLLLQLACLAFNDSNTVKYSDAEICRKIGISYNTYKKYHQELLDDGVMTPDGYIMECFVKKTLPSDYQTKASVLEEVLKSMDKTSKMYKQYQQVLSYIDYSFSEDQILSFKYRTFTEIIAGMFGKEEPEKPKVEVKYCKPIILD